MTFFSKLIEIAKSQIGTCESPKGTNKGAKVEEYQRRAGYTFPVPWCLCFLYWCVDEACRALGEVNKLKRTGDCDTLLNWSKPLGIVYDRPAVGDFGFVMKTDSDAVHVFLVVGVDGNTLHTIEGNTNDDGSREGYAVCSRVRALSPSMKFARIAEALFAFKSLGSHEVYSLMFRGKEIDKLDLIDGSAYAPVRKTIKSVGMKAGTKTRTVIDSEIQYDGSRGIVAINKDVMRVKLIKGVAFAPIRELAAALGYSVSVHDTEITLA